jgi:molybdopterin-guanine dinucleotide biosynthesis protein A
MGGVAKGLLKAPGSSATLIERLCSEATTALPGAPLVLVGDAAPYAAMKLPSVADEPANVGPLGGLAGLLAYGEQRSARHVLALACDLPRLGRGLIARLANDAPDAEVVLIEQERIRNPLIARYQISTALPAARRALRDGKRSLQAVLDELEPQVVRLALSADEQASLADWDTPEDVTRDD